MYVRFAEGFEQALMPRGSFAGTLGDDPTFPLAIQKFLERVKKRPQDYEAVLLISAFHVEPFSSVQLQKVLAASFDDAKDPLEEAKAIQEKVLQALEVIYKEHLKDNDFGKLFNKEKQLISVVAKAFQETIKRLETKGWLEPLLIDALLADYPMGLTEQVGKPFVLYQLPVEITEQILNCRVPEMHYARLGQSLRLIAELREKDNAAFKQHVEQIRTLRKP